MLSRRLFSLLVKCQPSGNRLSFRNGYQINPQIIRHMSKQKPRKHLRCAICDKEFATDSSLNQHYGRRHFRPITDHLRKDPVKTYTAIFGNNYKHLCNSELRYENGLVITLTGDKKGFWYDFVEGKGGGPVKALQEHLGLPYARAVEYAASLTGLSDEELRELPLEESECDSRLQKLTGEQEDMAYQDERKLKNMQTAQKIWELSYNIKGTLAERYLVEHRKIPQDAIPHLAFRFIDRNKEYEDEIRGLVCSNPALVVGIKNPQGVLTGIQRIFLDEETGNKVTDYPLAKKSKGILKHSAGIIQEGKKGGVVYVVEGPETGASIAGVLGPKVTVLGAMSVSQFPDMAPNVLVYEPKIVIMAADKDTHPSAQRSSMKGFDKLSYEMKKRDIDFYLVLPTIEPETDHLRKSVDFNDVLCELGPEALRKQATQLE